MTIDTPAQLAAAIRKLPEGDRQAVPGRWYRSQREHWLGWLREYRGPGAYGRKVQSGRTAEYVYNHIVEDEMLRWLISAAGVDPAVVKAAERAAAKGTTRQSRSAAIRRHVPWSLIAAKLAR